MRILDERVEGYLHDLRPARSEVVSEMEAVAQRDSVPIVHWEPGRAGVTERIELIEGDARETIPCLSGPFDLLFVDAAKGQYREYIDLAEPLPSERALLVIDNLLVGGEVALPEGADRARSVDSAVRSTRSCWFQSAGWDRCCRSATESVSRRGSSCFRSLRPHPGRP